MRSVAASWLSEQCGMLPGVTGAVLVWARRGDGEPAQVACWPGDGGQRPDLALAARSAWSADEPLTDFRAPGQGTPVALGRVALPFATSGGLRGAVAFEIVDAKASESAVLVERLRAGAAWLDVLLRRAQAGSSSGDEAESSGAALALVRTALQRRELSEAATAAATELATRLGAERVSIGLVHRGRVRVEGISHSARFDSRANSISDLAAAMDEACDQDATLIHPALCGSPPFVLREHEALASRQGSGTVCTVPLAQDGRVVGALTAEWPKDNEPGSEVLASAGALAAHLGPALQAVRRADAGLLSRVEVGLRDRLHRWLGPEHPGARLIAIATATLLAFLAVAPGDYRVTAEATLEGRVQRAVVAGLEGYIAQADVRAGDAVKTGQVLGGLDDRDLLLERRKWAGRLEQLRREHREALASHDRPQVNILHARISQARAEIELLEENLARTRWVAPFDGIVVRGDLSQSLGSPVEKGDVLFEIAPLDGYRIVLRVDERDISDVQLGQKGRLALQALPGDSLPLTVDRITPVASSEGDRNVFRVEARLDTPVSALRPGMEGVAKIEIERRRLLWIWTHRIIDTVRLWAWSWWP